MAGAAEHGPAPAPAAAGGAAGLAVAWLVALGGITVAWWALALWPVRDAPYWLERTRFVCFGVRATGMPDAGGWIGLIGGPLGMLAILLAGWGRDLRALSGRTRGAPRVAIVALLFMLCASLLFVFARTRSRGTGIVLALAAESPLHVTDYSRLDLPAPSLALTAHDGTSMDLTALRGRPVFITFAYAHCETVCPVVVKDVLDAQAQLRSSSTPAAVLIVTLDPWRDTRSRLAPIARTWNLPVGSAWILGGDVADVEAALDRWNVPRSRDPGTGEITHPSIVYVIDGAGRIAFATRGGVTALIGLVERL